MKLIEIDIDSKQQPKELAEEFEQKNLEAGDRIYYKTAGLGERNFIVVALLFAAAVALSIYFLKKQKNYAFSNSVINDAFENGNIEDMEIQIEKDYGVAVSVEDKEQKDWYRFSLDQLAKSYGDNEPDYSHILVKEPNPLYLKQ